MIYPHFLRHSKNSKRVGFVPGIHKHIKEFAPTAKQFLPDVTQTVAESLESGGVIPSSVDLVVLIHLNWDHIGDPRMHIVSSHDRRDSNLRPRLDKTVVEAHVHALDVGRFRNWVGGRRTRDA
ncbi:hypothetical protein EV424DRAFT_1430122 [Suillus variegatus]|nr:hypothetical protein EV424DRAFT_1451889 [Suillus variegatus]KAG1805587.1 hypothetical protein EV424DRAFT_1430122 [Suillus variegatus]